MNLVNAAFENLAFVDDKIWFFSSTYNALFCYEKNAKYAKYMGSVSGEDLNATRLFGSVHVFDDYVYLIPCNAKAIVRYHIVSQKFEKVYELESDGDAKRFMASFRKGNVIYAFGFFSDKVLKYDMQENSYEYTLSLTSLLKDGEFNPKEPFFRNQCVSIEEYIYVPFYNMDGILIYNTKKDTGLVKRFSSRLMGYTGIVKREDTLICVPRKQDDDALLWNYVKDSIDIMVNKEQTGSIVSYCGGAFEGNRICFYLMMADHNRFLEEIFDDATVVCGNYLFVNQKEDKVVSYDGKNGILTVKDQLTENIQDIPIRIRESDRSLILNYDSHILFEQDEQSLNSFLKFLY